MRAAVNTRYGPPDVVHLTEIPLPSVGEHDVLIDVRATTVNRTDCGYRSGRPWLVRFIIGLRRPKATVLGNEFAGVVQAVGSQVQRFSVGDRVFGYNEGPFGGHAEYMSVRESGPIATIPADMTFEQAAASTEGAHYALSLIDAAAVHAGSDVLVYGATGAIGSAAVQLVKARGARVTAVCSTESVELVRGLGADRVVDYTAVDFTADEQTYDVVLDAVGKSTFRRCKRLLRPHGLYLSTELGAGGQNVWLALSAPLRRGKKVLFPIPNTFGREALEQLRDLMVSGHFTSVVDRHYPLAEIVDAYRYVETGQKIGSVVILVGEQGA